MAATKTTNSADIPFMDEAPFSQDILPMQGQHSMAQQVAACIQCHGGHFECVL
jgi:cytochrome c553